MVRRELPSSLDPQSYSSFGFQSPRSSGVRSKMFHTGDRGRFRGSCSLSSWRSLNRNVSRSRPTIEQKNADAWMLAFMRDFHSKLFGHAAEDGRLERVFATAKGGGGGGVTNYFVEMDRDTISRLLKNV